MVSARRPLAAVVAAVLTGSLLAACGGGGGRPSSSPTTVARPSTLPPGTAPSPPAPPRASVQWSSCQGSAGPKGYDCATVMVPRNPTHPDGTTIGMALDRHRATGAKVGSLLVNPGGPGASGVDGLPDLVAHMPASLLARFDVVGFDPPGVARTAPITCLDSAGLAQYFHVDPAPPTPAGLAALVATDRTFAAGCQARSGAELPYVSTVDAAEDLDLVRAALGDSKLTYLGFSYGTLLGATYAGLFPTHVRAMVLDGALDPALPTIDQLDQQAASIDGQLQLFFRTCAQQTSCPWRPAGDPTAAFEALVAKVRATPLPAQHTARTVGPAELLYGTAVTLYSTASWNDLAYALAGRQQGRRHRLSDPLRPLHRPAERWLVQQPLRGQRGHQLPRRPGPLTGGHHRGGAGRGGRRPHFRACRISTVRRPVRSGRCRRPVASDRSRPPGSPPIVVVGSTGDPITPYHWAQSLAGELSHGVLLTRVGDGHTGYESSSCVRQAVDQYLITLAPPPAGTRCASN